jgi:hypothetical protein
MEIIKYLPDELKRHIYKQYLWFDVEKKPKCDKVLYWFEHDKDAHEFKLNLEIIYLMEELLLCKTSMKYLCDCDESIKHCYNNHYINNIKRFTQENKFTSFLHAIILHKHF